ncbi:hypothetical protein F5Y16DRAFT_367078 [Xylariaceae sp. FL0255]|nr:hypothetical protein F5Y16DRAFT_367078 [Xylariaceae sp. FL0255]
MVPSRVPAGLRDIRLRQDVDVQLDQAWFDQHWSQVANLARQRYRSTQDEYYKVVELVAKSFIDSHADRAASREAIQALVDQVTVIRDGDTLDLYEMAAQELKLDHSRTIGVLRSKLVKSLAWKTPEDEDLALRCLEACMWHSDWENAQQITVTLSKNTPKDRRTLFLNILTTFLVSTMDDIPENKKKLFANLAKAQVDRAFNLRLPAGMDRQSVSMQSQEEVGLWLEIQDKYGSQAENHKSLIETTDWGPLAFLKNGFYQAFFTAMHFLVKDGRNDDIIRISDAIFDRVQAIDLENLTAYHESLIKQQRAPYGEGYPDYLMDKHFLYMSIQYGFWDMLFSTMKAQPDSKKAMKKLRDRVDKAIRVAEALTWLPWIHPVQKQNQSKFQLLTTFARASASTMNLDAKTTKVQHLIRFVTDNLDVKDLREIVQQFLSDMSGPEVKSLIYILPSAKSEDLNPQHRLSLETLALQIKFSVAMYMRDGHTCSLCGTQDENKCRTCVQAIATQTLQLYTRNVRQNEVLKAIEASGGQSDSLRDLTILGANCLLTLARNGNRNWGLKSQSALVHMDIPLFLQALLWLDADFRRAGTDNSMRLFLVKLYLLVGCVSKAIELWEAFGVKNTLLESLGMLCVDRLSTVSPAHFIAGPSRQRSTALEIIKHFEKAAQLDYPKAVQICVRNNHVAEVVEIISKVKKSSHSCTLVLALVEKRRGVRLNGGKNDIAMADEPLAASLTPDWPLFDTTNRKVYPDGVSDGTTPIEEFISYGPQPTSIRCHLSILAEHFIDFVCYVQTKDLKPQKASQMALGDCQAAALICDDLHSKIEKLIGDRPAFANGLGFPEQFYFWLVNELTNLTKLVLRQDMTPTPDKELKQQISQAFKMVHRIMELQTSYFFTPPVGLPSSRIHTLHGVAALHAMGMLRESSLLIKHTYNFLTAVLDRTKQTEKARGVYEASVWMIPEIKKMGINAGIADVKMKNRVRQLNESLAKSGWVDRILDWTVTCTYRDREHEQNRAFLSGICDLLTEAVPQDHREVWANTIADSWRDVAKGWLAVKFD